jgi:hypothetical protein
MAAAALSSFRINRDQKGFLLRFEDIEGDVTELTATYDQLDAIGEVMEEMLAFGDIELERDDDGEEGEGAD